MLLLALKIPVIQAWVDVSEEIAANVQRARMKMVELAKAHAKALMPSFGDGKEDQRSIEGLTQEITGLLRKSEKQLKRLAAAGPYEDSNVRKNVQRSPLATDFRTFQWELRKRNRVRTGMIYGNEPKLVVDPIIDDDNFGRTMMAQAGEIRVRLFTVERGGKRDPTGKQMILAFGTRA
ncbi:hypothetical protein NC652_030426 [Populus alba x Populus x berolinensis]|nr:hypothetical protein NC652_030426 [Populus alba x Populus x berolinensis]